MRIDELPDTAEKRLAAFTFPALTFEASDTLPTALRPVWSALSRRAYGKACELAIEALSAARTGAADERAALYVGLAAGAAGSGNRKRAMTAAEESVTLLPRQWAAHRLIMEVFWADGDFENAYFYLSTLLEPETEYDWDQPLTAMERHLSIAALAWRLQDWDGVSDHLNRVFPDGVETMPIPLREDAFRVAVYRDRKEDAATAAHALLAAYPIPEIDTMLRTLDSRGWTDQALDLYRIAFKNHGESQLLRRRLVGLCVRQGCVDEARSLTEGNALDLAA